MKLTLQQIELLVGSFVLLGFVAFLFLVFKVANVRFDLGQNTYDVYAEFDNIGGLKVGSPVKVGGVVVGEVSSVSLNPDNMMPLVTLKLSQAYTKYPNNSSVSILTSGLLGSQYIGMMVGFEDEDTEYLSHGDTIYETHSAIVLEELIGKFLYSQQPQ